MMAGTQYPMAAKAVDTLDYRLSLIISLEDLSKVYSEYLNHLAKVSEDRELTRKCVCMMVVVMKHILPKLKGGGPKWNDLIKRFEPFQIWSTNILIPLNDTGELERVHVLFDLLLEAYDVLNISNV